MSVKPGRPSIDAFGWRAVHPPRRAVELMVVNQVLSNHELEGVSVLVVDDDVDTRDLLAELLAMFGMEVRQAASGNAAFRMFREQRPAILLSDIRMGDGSGLDLIRLIRALPPEAGGLTPAIAISGDSPSQACVEAGFHYHFVKPVEPLQLLDAIRDFVRDDRSGRARWSVLSDAGGDVHIRFEGHVTRSDMRHAVAHMAEILKPLAEQHRVIVDLTHLEGFDPSVGAAAQTVAWTVRDKIRGAVIVGGSRLSQWVARGTCLILGVPVEFLDRNPPIAAASR